MVRSRTILTTMLATLALGACAEAGADAANDAGEADGATASRVDAVTAEETRLALGRQVYDDVCSQCHSLQPPHEEATPLTHIARRLKRRLETEAAFTEHVITHIPDPSEERSLMPAHAIEKFGLMPAQALTDEQLENVAAWLWVMADSAQMGGGEGGGMRGEGGGMRGGGRGMGGGGGGMGGGAGMGPPPPDTAGAH